jgi:hypothetical protein
VAVPLNDPTEMLQYYSVFFPKMFEITTEKVFHADDKYVLRLHGLSHNAFILPLATALGKIFGINFQPVVKTI